MVIHPNLLAWRIHGQRRLAGYHPAHHRVAQDRIGSNLAEHRGKIIYFEFFLVKSPRNLMFLVLLLKMIPLPCIIHFVLCLWVNNSHYTFQMNISDHIIFISVIIQDIFQALQMDCKLTLFPLSEIKTTLPLKFLNLFHVCMDIKQIGNMLLLSNLYILLFLLSPLPILISCFFFPSIYYLQFQVNHISHFIVLKQSHILLLFIYF